MTPDGKQMTLEQIERLIEQRQRDIDRIRREIVRLEMEQAKPILYRVPFLIRVIAVFLFGWFIAELWTYLTH